MTQSQSFRANVGIVALNDKWEVLALERIDRGAQEGHEEGHRKRPTKLEHKQQRGPRFSL
jgi:hypothetical protein